MGLANRLLQILGCTKAVGPIIAFHYTGNLHHLCGRDRWRHSSYAQSQAA